MQPHITSWKEHHAMTYNKAIDDCGHERSNKPLPSLLWGQLDETSSSKKEPYNYHEFLYGHCGLK